MSGASLSGTVDKAIWFYPQLKMTHALDIQPRGNFGAIGFNPPFLYFDPIVTTTSAHPWKAYRDTSEHSDHMYLTTWQTHVLNKAVEERTYGIGIVLEDQTS